MKIIDLQINTLVHCHNRKSKARRVLTVTEHRLRAIGPFEHLTVDEGGFCALSDHEFATLNNHVRKFPDYDNT